MKETVSGCFFSEHSVDAVVQVWSTRHGEFIECLRCISLAPRSRHCESIHDISLLTWNRFVANCCGSMVSLPVRQHAEIIKESKKISGSGRSHQCWSGLYVLLR